MSGADHSPDTSRATTPRGLVVVWALAMAALVLLKASPLTFVDPDLWHQMSLARETLRLGHVPTRDSFSYTSTVYPIVHHEWGAGMLWLAVSTAVGRHGFLFVKYALVAAVALLCTRSSRRRGADGVTLVACALPAILAAHYGFTTIRAQLLSMVALALLMNVLAEERAGRRGWLLGWLFVHVVWLNVHAGFVVGLGILGLTAVERALRREPFVHLALVTVAAAALVMVNPYGVDYVRYLARGLLIARPNAPEWAPLWANLRWGDIATWASMLVLSSYAVRARGLRACEGVSAVAVCLLFALLHHRHLTLLAVVWFAVAPAWLADTPLFEGLRSALVPRAKLITALGVVVFVVCFTGGTLLKPWALTVPTEVSMRREGWPTYPVGAADYLRAVGFRGNLMTPFVEGAYVMWRLNPQGVRVSYDGRYEAAYSALVTLRHRAFYAAAPGWQGVLRAYPTDMVLVPRDAPVFRAMFEAPGWRLTYGDDLYALFAPAGSRWAFVDRRGRTFPSTFP